MDLRVLIYLNFDQGKEAPDNLFNVPDVLLPVRLGSESKGYQTAVIVNDKIVSGHSSSTLFCFSVILYSNNSIVL